MKRRSLLILCVALGAVTTTLDGRLAHDRGKGMAPIPAVMDDSHLPFPREFTDASDATWTLDVEIREGFGIRAEGYAYEVKGDDTEHTVALAGSARFGWPCSSMRSDENVAPELLGADVESLRALSTEEIWWAMDYPADGIVKSPVLPHFPGFIINTLFYAAIWGGVFFGFTSAKRLVRVKRGRCPRCGYDLRGAPGLAAGCSECGWNR